tara:strand:+ start:183 stop:431 length:249 start_codon:yes stop_codon:yes gene_type:complete
MKKTKGQQLGITKFPYVEWDKNGNITYKEFLDGWWENCGYDNNGNKTYGEYSNGDWYRIKCDEHGKTTYYENSDELKEYYIG